MNLIGYVERKVLTHVRSCEGSSDQCEIMVAGQWVLTNMTSTITSCGKLRQLNVKKHNLVLARVSNDHKIQQLCNNATVWTLEHRIFMTAMLRSAASSRF